MALLPGGSVTAEDLFMEPAEGQDAWAQLSLTEESALTVTGRMELRHAVFCADGGILDLTGAAMDVTDESRVLPARLDAFRLDNAALTVTAWSRFETPYRGAGFDAEGLHLLVDGGVMFVTVGGEMNGADITVTGPSEEQWGELSFECGKMALRDSSLTTEANGHFWTNFCYLNMYNTRVTNRGHMEFNGYGEHYVRTDRASRITNYGDMEITMDDVTLQQPIDNQGDLYIMQDPNKPDKFDMYMGNPAILEE